MLKGPDRRRVASTLLAASLVSGLLGCCGAPARLPEAAPPEAEAEAASIRIREEAARVASLDRFESAGVAILHLRDPDGTPRREQLDLLWLLERPLRMAMRLKLSVTDTLAWLGSDGIEWWLFLPREQPAVAYRGGIDAFGGDGADAAFPAPLRSPRWLLLLSGLETPGPAATPPRWDGARGAWRVGERIDARHGLVEVDRWYSRGGTALVAVEIRSIDGVLRSELSRHAPVEVPGRSEGEWPRIARHIDLFAADRGEPDGGVASLRLDRPSGAGRRIRPQLFEFDRLRQSMPVAEIVEVGR
jgi:hypothetical protein